MQDGIKGATRLYGDPKPPVGASLIADANAPAAVKQTALFVIPHWKYGLEPWMAGGIALLFGALAAIVVPKDEQKA